MENKNHKKNGFTIIELLLVIALTVIIFSGVFAVQGRFLVNTYLDTNTEQIVQQLRLAQMRSISKFKDSEWGVYFDEDVDGNDDKFVLFKGSNYENRDQSYDIITNLPDSIALSSINLTGGTDYIVFNKVTGATKNSGSIQIFDNQEGVNTILINGKGLTGVNEIPAGSGSGDSTEPLSITDLALSGATEESLDLSWSATGDDGIVGIADLYDVRYSTSTITEENWATATHVAAEPTPAAYGSAESMTVSGLSSATTYYFAMKALDEVPNESSLSNVVSLTTLDSSSQTESLVVNTSKAYLSNGNKYLKGITISNSAEEDIIIDKMTVEWNNEPYKRTYLRVIRINSRNVWVGYGYSGVEVDIKDFTLSPKQKSYSINQIRFTKNMKGSNITITLTMADKSTITTPVLKF
ncbi:prepilin-type N-terminal cleavage/methylation domain-containing protein [Patescibacteria group bacterium]